MKKPTFSMKYQFDALKFFQSDHKRWVNYNFPDENAHSPLLGLAEEVGELAHAHLKREQGIRGTAEEHQAAAADAIGDIMIYLTSYCNRNGFDLADCLVVAWEEIRDRDWRNYPETGKPVLVENMGDYRQAFGGDLTLTDQELFEAENPKGTATCAAEGQVEVQRDLDHVNCPLRNDHSSHYWKRPGYRGSPDKNFFCRGVGGLC